LTSAARETEGARIIYYESSSNVLQSKRCPRTSPLLVQGSQVSRKRTGEKKGNGHTYVSLFHERSGSKRSRGGGTCAGGEKRPGPRKGGWRASRALCFYERRRGRNGTEGRRASGRLSCWDHELNGERRGSVDTVAFGGGRVNRSRKMRARAMRKTDTSGPRARWKGV